MQVERYDLRELKRVTRKRKPGARCAEMALGQRVGGTVTFNNQWVKQSPPIASGLTHWYKTGRTLVLPTIGAASASGGVDSALPALYVNESPTGLARILTASAGFGGHNITRAITVAETGTTLTLRTWFRKKSFSDDLTWVFLGAGAGPAGAYFNCETGAVGTTVGVLATRVLANVAPTTGAIWYMLEVDINYSGGGGAVIFGALADGGTATWLATGLESFVYDQLQVIQDKVSQWTDLVGTDHLLQAGANIKPLWRAASDQFQGEPSLNIAAGHSIAASTAANWQTLHDGTGSSIAIVFKTPRTANVEDQLLTTNGNSTTATGMRLSFNGFNPGINWSVGGAASNKISLNRFFNSSAEAAAGHWVGLTLASVNNPDAELWVDGVKASVANPSGGYTVAVPATGLVVGGGTFAGEVSEILVWNRALTTSEWEQTGYYLKSTHGTL